MCVLVCVFILCAAARLQSDIAFGEPSLRPVELSQPPLVPLLQHADDVPLREAQQHSDGVAGGEVKVSVRSGRPRGDSTGQQRGRGLRGGSKASASLTAKRFISRADYTATAQPEISVQLHLTLLEREW